LEENKNSVPDAVNIVSPDIDTKIDSENIDKVVSEYKDEVQAEAEKKPRKKRELKNKPVMPLTDKTPEQIASENFFADITSIGFTLGMDLLVKRLPNPIPLSNEEKEIAKNAFSPLAKKYAGRFIKFGEEINFAVCLVIILSTRIKPVKKEVPLTIIKPEPEN
jgi:hypothetical protein